MHFWLAVRTTKIRFSDDSLLLKISSWPGPFSKWKAFGKSNQEEPSKNRNANNVIASYYCIMTHDFSHSTLVLAIHSDLCDASLAVLSELQTAGHALCWKLSTIVERLCNQKVHKIILDQSLWPMAIVKRSTGIHFLYTTNIHNKNFRIVLF